MVDQTQTDKTIQAVADTAKTVAATTEAMTQTATATPVAKRAPKARAAKTVARKTTTRATTAKKSASKTARSATAKTATPRKAATTARKAADTVVKAAKKTTQRAATSATKQIERTATMTNDFSQMFAGFQLPGSDKFQGLFADAGARSQDLVAKSRNAGEEMTDLAKANVEAIAEAARIAATGVKSIGQDVVASSRTGFEHASEAIKTLADAKSPTEFFQLQSELMRSAFDRMVSESSKLTEQMVKLAGEAIQPISNRASVNAERVNELMA